MKVRQERGDRSQQLRASVAVALASAGGDITADLQHGRICLVLILMKNPEPHFPHERKQNASRA